MIFNGIQITWDVCLLHSLHVDVRLMLPEVTEELCTRKSEMNRVFLALEHRSQFGVGAQKQILQAEMECTSSCLVLANSISVETSSSRHALVRNDPWIAEGSMLSHAELACDSTRNSWNKGGTLASNFYLESNFFCDFTEIYLIWHSFPTKWN